MKIGEDVETSEIEDIISAQKPEEAALLIYTVSGRGKWAWSVINNACILPPCSLGPLGTRKVLWSAMTM